VNLTKTDADIFVPDGAAVEAALARTTHLAIGAHQDDLEFMSLHGILECFDREDRWYTGVTVTDGSGSPRTGPFADYSGEEMSRIRVAEQRKAALLGRYGCQIQLMFQSSELKDGGNTDPIDDLRSIVEFASPQIVYLHNPADKHDTHVACCLRSIEALRKLPAEKRPAKLYGCEVWRDLDWMTDADKVVLPLIDPDGLGIALADVFESQIAGGKRYDLAIRGRWLANATFHESHEVDRHSAASFVMDLTPLLDDPALDLGEFTLSLMRRTENDISDRIARMNR
jgi:LmbE family N-acetylglucosaminyl deacetylase